MFLSWSAVGNSTVVFGTMRSYPLSVGGKKSDSLLKMKLFGGTLGFLTK